MPKIDFKTIDDVVDFSPLPAGKYVCKVVDIEEASTQYGDEMWKLRFQVVQGEHANRFLFDNMVFSEAAIKRVKLICSRLGLDVSGEINLTPDMLKGRACVLTAQLEEYEDEGGKKKSRNVVPFAGYEPFKGEVPEIESIEEEGEPF